MAYELTTRILNLTPGDLGPEARPLHRQLLWTLADAANPGGRAEGVTLAHLARLAWVTPDTVRRGLADLKRWGLLRIFTGAQGRGIPPTYQLILPAVQAALPEIDVATGLCLEPPEKGGEKRGGKHTPLSERGGKHTPLSDLVARPSRARGEVPSGSLPSEQDQDQDPDQDPVPEVDQGGRGESEGGRGVLAAPALTAFDRFWAAYPNKVGKIDARKAWVRQTGVRPTLDQILAAIERQRASRRWQEGYIPNPGTWLRQGRWDDGPEPIAAPIIPKRTQANQAALDEVLRKGPPPRRDPLDAARLLSGGRHAR